MRRRRSRKRRDAQEGLRRVCGCRRRSTTKLINSFTEVGLGQNPLSLQRSKGSARNHRHPHPSISIPIVRYATVKPRHGRPESRGSGAEQLLKSKRKLLPPCNRGGAVIRVEIVTASYNSRLRPYFPRFSADFGTAAAASLLPTSNEHVVTPTRKARCARSWPATPDRDPERTLSRLRSA